MKKELLHWRRQHEVPELGRATPQCFPVADKVQNCASTGRNPQEDACKLWDILSMMTRFDYGAREAAGHGSLPRETKIQKKTHHNSSSLFVYSAILSTMASPIK